MSVPKSRSLRVLSLNLANAFRDESIPNYRFGVRFAPLIAYLKQGDYDIICLQEIRKCLDRDGVTVLQPKDIILRFAFELGLLPLFAGNNYDELAFWRCTLYNPQTVFHLHTQPFWTGEHVDLPSGPQFSMLILRSTFQLISETVYDKGEYKSGTSFHIYNIHSPMAFPGRMQYCRKLLTLVDGTPSLYMGDFNTIPDLGGPEQLELLKTVLNEESSHIAQTFTSFPHDNNPATGEPWRSKLDHLFSTNWPKPSQSQSQSQESQQSWSITVTTDDFSQSQLSDHYPLIITA